MADWVAFVPFFHRFGLHGVFFACKSALVLIVRSGILLGEPFLLLTGFHFRPGRYDPAIFGLIFFFVGAVHLR